MTVWKFSTWWHYLQVAPQPPWWWKFELNNPRWKLNICACLIPISHYLETKFDYCYFIIYFAYVKEKSKLWLFFWHLPILAVHCSCFYTKRMSAWRRDLLSVTEFQERMDSILTIQAVLGVMEPSWNHYHPALWVGWWSLRCWMNFM